ncbi:MAG: MlaD family protein [Candidatus Polarisedimenticolia bacterium]
MNEDSRLAEAKVGLFVVGALTVLLAGALWISQVSLFGKQQIPYQVLMKDSAGVGEGDGVRVAGVEVGRVQRVTLRPGQEWPVALEVVLDPEILVRTDSSARIGSLGLLGSPFLEIDPGSAQAPPLAPGSPIMGQEAATLAKLLAQVDQISDKAIHLVDQTTRTLDQISGQLQPLMTQAGRFLSEENAGAFRDLLVTSRGMIKESAPRIAALVARLDSTSETLDRSLEGMPDLSRRISAVVDDLDTALGTDGSRLIGVLDSAQSSIASAGDTLSMVGEKRIEVEGILTDLRDAAANLKALSQTLKERPFSLIRIKPEPDRQPGSGTAQEPR